ncbi:hypothetical protein [Pseudorhodoplanes sp.]|uniref:hypothetical protein n=1 Tax=Pseudorhodoplanes sp. TaxID=1934341 RepID=UPI00391C3000
MLQKRKREKVEADLESGPQVDQRRDDIMRKMLAMPPKQHSEMKVRKAAVKKAR